MDDVDKQVTLVKKVANSDEATGEDGAFALGDTVKFDITATNTGNQDLSGIVVKDIMDGARIEAGEEYRVTDDNAAVIADLKAGADNAGDTVVVKAEYEIKVSDLGNTNLRNVATAEIDDGIEGEGTSDPIPVDEKLSRHLHGNTAK